MEGRVMWKQIKSLGVDYLPYEVLHTVFVAKRLGDQVDNAIRGMAYHGVPSLRTVDFEKIKSSNTVFILGSGWSLNDISDEQWAVVRRADSFGFNFSILHEHVPTVYTFELSHSTSEAYRRQYELFQSVTERKRDQYRDVVKFITSLNPIPGRTGMFGVCDPGFKSSNFYAIETVRSIARNPNELRRMIRYFERLGVFQRTDHVGPLFKASGTMIMLMALAVNLGYERIVMLGVDMIDRRYFYEDEMKYPEAKGFRSSADTPVYSLLMPSKKYCRIDDAVFVLNETVFAPRGIQLFVANESSVLHPRVPLAPEDVWS